MLEETLRVSGRHREALRLELRAGTLEIAEGFAILRRFILIRNPSAVLNPTEQSFYDHLLSLSEANALHP